MKDNKESIKDIIENILYWETCPDDYKERLAKSYGLQDLLKEIKDNK